MKQFNQWKSRGKKLAALATACTMAVSLMPAVPLYVEAADFTGSLTQVTSAAVDSSNKNIVTVTFNDGVKGKITFLEDGIFRYNVDPKGEFSKYAVPRYEGVNGVGRIPQYPDESSKYSHPAASVDNGSDTITVKSGSVSILFDKATAKMTIKDGDKVVMQEAAPLAIGAGSTVQTLAKQDGENFYGGGTQNGRFVHTGQVINIKNESNWTDGGVSSPNPFYYTTSGYGVLRNTWQDGTYDFGKTESGAVKAAHNESEFDAYYFVSDGANGREVAQDILQEYYKVTGNPVLLPSYAFYEGHLNALNRDSWYDDPESDVNQGKNGKGWTVKGTDSSDSEGVTHYEYGGNGFHLQSKMHAESLNGTGPKADTRGTFPADADTPYEYSARAIIDDYVEYDMPLGYFLPNDGYSGGYGQNGYYQYTGTVDERNAALKANLENLKNFADYAKEKGVATGLWTQSYLTPAEMPNEPWHLLRDFDGETDAGVTTLKTDVAWVGPGYSMQLSGVKKAYNIATTKNTSTRPYIISLDGWAGSQRYNGIWTGDQYGGQWEYIRFHIPTYIGASLSGNPNVASDMDGIFGGDKLISTRDYQWKSFTQGMMNMDGWGSYMKTPYTFGDPYTGINRMYLKVKSELMPYFYTTAYSAANIETGNNDKGLPMMRAMFLEYPDDNYAYSRNMQYQYMLGSDILVAPIYQDTAMDLETYDDVRNNIYLPDKNAVWVDFFTGDQYKGGQVLNNFDAPLWKLPVFVKNGSIIPKYEANNSPSLTDKTKRIVEFWPSGSSQYTAVEDDGTTIKNTTSQDKDYGTIEDVSYGQHVSTTYTSSVAANGTATLTAKKSTGSYTGYNASKTTTFVVHASQKPSKVTAKNGTAALAVQEVASKSAFDSATPASGTAVYFYDANPKIETYATQKEAKFAAMVANVKVQPKLYVKFASVDTQSADQTLVIEGFKNVGNFAAEKEDQSLGVPTLTEDESAKTPSSITLNWTAVNGAESYELLIDGMLYSVGNELTYTNEGLDTYSEHTYRVRARKATGYSAWSSEQKMRSADDPWRDTPTPASVEWTGDLYNNQKADLAFNNDLDGNYFHSDTKAIGETLTVDYGKAYELEKIEYYPRTDASNGTVTQMKFESSLDGIHWTEAQSYNWQRDASTKTIPVGTAARYIRFTPLESVGGFFSARELKVYAKENSKGFAVGSTNKLSAVADADYTNMKNYLGTSLKDGSNFTDQIKARYGDINMNDVYDVYDYAYTMFALDEGTTKTGSVGGTLSLDTDKIIVEAGDEFTIKLNVSNGKNINALGKVMSYDPNKMEYISVEKQGVITNMENLTVNKVYDDGTAYLNLAFANRGDMELYSGSGMVATVKMRAKRPLYLGDEKVIDLTAGMLIGPDFSTKGAVKGETSVPDTLLSMADFNITMTNEKLSEDNNLEETNVSKLIQQKSYSGLFDGRLDRDFEFLWDIEQNREEATGKLPAYVTLPVTLHLELTSPMPLENIIVSNANKANGYVTKVTFKVTYTNSAEVETTPAELDGDYAGWDNYTTFEHNFDQSKQVQKIDVTIENAVMKNDDGEVVDVQNMLTLAEIEVNKVILPESLDLNEIQKELKEYGEIKNNPIQENIERYVTDGWSKFQTALQTANQTMTEESSDEEILAAMTALRSAFTGLADRKVLLDAITKYGAVENTGSKYAGNSWTAFQDELGKVRALMTDSENATQDSFAEAVDNLDAIYDALADRTELRGTVADYKAVQNSDGKYTEKTWNAFQSAIKNAEENVLVDDRTTKDDLANEVAILREAYEALADRTELKAAIEQYKNEQNPGNKYTQDSWRAFQNAITAAQGILENGETEKKDLDAAIQGMRDAFDGLADLTDVNTALDSYGNAQNTGTQYTADSWKKYSDALAAARSVLSNPKATAEEIKNAADALKAAFEGLKKNTVVQKPNLPKVTAGKTYAVNGANYKVLTTDATGGTAEYAGYAGDMKKTVNVPATVTISGGVYKVVSIANKALQGKKKLTKVVVGNNVSKIGVSAFEKCVKLKTVKLGKGITTIGKHAFCGDKKLRTLNISSSKLKKVAKHSLSKVKKLKIKVPKKQVKKYKKLFKNKGTKSFKVKK